MRLWSIHPKYLDQKGLTALWREALLAQKVLEDKTKAYKNHPQLKRFKNTRDPITYIGTYLYYVHQEAKRRNYNFNIKKITAYNTSIEKIPVKEGQIKYEFKHLQKKLKTRNPQKYKENKKEKHIKVNPIFYIVPGEIEEWEKKAHKQK